MSGRNTYLAADSGKPLRIDDERSNEELAVALIDRLVKYKSHRLQIKQALGLARYKGQGKMSADYRKLMVRVNKNE